MTPAHLRVLNLASSIAECACHLLSEDGTYVPGFESDAVLRADRVVVEACLTEAAECLARAVAILGGAPIASCASRPPSEIEVARALRARRRRP